MDFVQNFPAVSILLCLFAGIVSSGLKKNAARRINRGILCLCGGKSSRSVGK